MKLLWFVLLLSGCAWHPVNLYDTPAHIACAHLHDGIQSDVCHVNVYRSGNLESIEIADEIRRLYGFEG